jgi:hypothetical protein
MVLAANVVWALFVPVLLHNRLAWAQQDSTDDNSHGRGTGTGSGSSANSDITTTTSVDDAPAVTTDIITDAPSITVPVTSTTTSASPPPSSSSTSLPSGNAGASTASPAFCEARTINYITHGLPQLCFTSTWSSTSTSNTALENGTVSASDSTSKQLAEDATGDAAPTESKPADSTTTSDDEPAATPFMSFEDWKEMMLRRSGQDPQALKHRKAGRQRGEDRTPPDMGHAGLGEEGEIDLDFEDYLDDPGDYRRGGTRTEDGDNNEQSSGDVVPREERNPDQHRLSKDAGKTSKERFSYSSFDAGATIIKTSPGAKNAKAILVENKDSYMLLECSSESKYVIIELTDDILVDTIAIANYEFFSSMIRHFRVTVSAFYPAKDDHWWELGTFEARNLRDVQPFLVENPQAWAKYVRIDFLTHYSNEYYCPVSLVRVHGLRMVDKWKEQPSEDMETISDVDDDEVKAIDNGETPQEYQATVEPDQAEERTDSEDDYIPWWHPSSNLFNASYPYCSPEELIGHETGPSQDNETGGEGQQRSSAANNMPQARDSMALSESRSSKATQDKTASATNVPPASASIHSNVTQSVVSGSPASSNRSSTSDAASSSTTSATKTTAPNQKHRGSTGSAPSASPTVQEGFFNAITKRLNNVESNLTLSLQYLEDHSRYLQEALLAAEQKQVSKVTTFLNSLNQTVFSELRVMRDQYEQIWQSTVIALETQREQSERDIVALSSRLNLLADEVVFQKRMAIVQAVLLLCCLFLVIFSRGVPIPYLAPLMDQNGVTGSYIPTSPSQMSPSILYSNTQGRDVDRRHPNTNTLQDVAAYPRSTGDLYSTEIAQAALVDDTHSFSDMPQSGRLSPPLTPGGQTDADGPMTTSTSLDLQMPALRRTMSSQHQLRKPLPALPEDPSSP